MKFKLLSLIVAFMMVFTFTLPCLAIESSESAGKNLTANPSPSLTTQETIVKSYVDSYGHWNEWYTYYASSVQDMYFMLVRNPVSRANKTGVLAVDSAELLYIEKVDNSYAPFYPELSEYMAQENNYECYLAGIDMTVTSDSQYYYDGINYKLIVIVYENGEWKIGAQCGAPVELIADVDGTVETDEALMFYAEKAGISFDTNSTYGVGWGFIGADLNNPPEEITVGNGYGYINDNGKWTAGINGQPFVIDFRNYIYNSTANEVYETYHEDAIKACAVAIKMYAWWCHLGTYREALGCDLLVNFDQAYDASETSYPNSVTEAVDDIINYYIVSGSNLGSNSGKLFSTCCNNFTQYDVPYSGNLVQSGAQNLALNYDQSWQQIVHYYFDNTTFNSTNTGVVQIGTHTW